MGMDEANEKTLAELDERVRRHSLQLREDEALVQSATPSSPADAAIGSAFQLALNGWADGIYALRLCADLIRENATLKDQLDDLRGAVAELRGRLDG